MRPCPATSAACHRLACDAEFCQRAHLAMRALNVAPPPVKCPMADGGPCDRPYCVATWCWFQHGQDAAQAEADTVAMLHGEWPVGNVREA